jgi:hypothetical protein
MWPLLQLGFGHPRPLRVQASHILPVPVNPATSFDSFSSMGPILEVSDCGIGLYGYSFEVLALQAKTYQLGLMG